MVIISFRDGTDWYKANWVFRQLSKDFSQRFADDAEMVLEMEKAQAIGALLLDKLDADLAARLATAIAVVATETLDGKLPGWTGAPTDEDGRRMYRECMSELAQRTALLPKQS